MLLTRQKCTFFLQCSRNKRLHLSGGQKPVSHDVKSTRIVCAEHCARGALRSMPATRRRPTWALAWILACLVHFSGAQPAVVQSKGYRTMSHVRSRFPSFGGFDSRTMHFRSPESASARAATASKFLREATTSRKSRRRVGRWHCRRKRDACRVIIHCVCVCVCVQTLGRRWGRVATVLFRQRPAHKRCSIIAFRRCTAVCRRSH